MTLYCSSSERSKVGPDRTGDGELEPPAKKRQVEKSEPLEDYSHYGVNAVELGKV